MLKHGFKEKLIFPVTIALIAVIFFLSIFTYVRSMSFSRYLINEKFISNVNSLDFHLGEFSNNTHKAAISMAGDNAVRKAVKDRDTEKIIQRLEPLCDTYRVTYFTVTDSEGLVLGRTYDPAAHGDSVAGQQNVKNALNGKVTTYFEDGTYIKIAIRTGAPIYDEDGILIGVISAGVRLDTDEIVDELKHLLNSEVTVFLGDTRIATTIIMDGHRIKDTKLDPHIAGILIDEKREYNGEALIFGNRYETHYKPVINADNDVFAIIFVGIPIEVLASESNALVIALISIGVLGIALSLILLYSLRRAMTANRTKNLFLANMSHEMRTPINAIIGMSNIAEAAKDPESRADAISKLKGAATHLAGLVDDILNITKTETISLKLEPTPFRIKELLEQAAEIVGSHAAEKHQELSVNIDPDLPDVLMCDEKRLMQVIMNLLGNAVKFTPDHGKIGLETRLLDVNSGQHGEEGGVCTIQFIISDMGIGISKEQQSYLFDPFVQADSGSTKKYGGAGLGLAISKRIVEMMGGEISVESEPGKGSVFSFTIQAVTVRTEESGVGKVPVGVQGDLPDNNGTPCFEGHHILLAEDVELNREIMVAMLESTKVSIDFANNGLEAVQMFSEAPGLYSLIFMDIQMPEMDGYDATSNIRALNLPEAKSVPIVALSANMYDEDINASLKAGMNAHIGKPVDIDEVYDILKRYVDQTI